MVRWGTWRKCEFYSHCRTRVQPTVKKTREIRNELPRTGHAAVWMVQEDAQKGLLTVDYLAMFTNSPPTRGSDLAARQDQASSLFPGFYGSRLRFYFFHVLPTVLTRPDWSQKALFWTSAAHARTNHIRYTLAKLGGKSHLTARIAALAA